MIQISINKWMGTQIVIYPYTVKLLRNKNDWTIDAVNNMDDLQDDYTEWKKPIQKKKRVCTGWSNLYKI